MLFSEELPFEPSKAKTLEIYKQRQYEVEKFELFAQTFPDAKNCREVLYIGCGADTAPYRAFKDKRIMHVDYYRPNLDVLQQQIPDAEVHFADAKEFIPTTTDNKANMIIVSGTFTPRPLNYLRTGGYLLACISPNCLDEILKDQTLHLVGIIWRNYDAAEPGNHYRIQTVNDANREELRRYTEPIGPDDLEVVLAEDPMLAEKMETRRAAGKILEPSVSLAREILRYTPRKKGHSENRPDMFIFHKEETTNLSQ